MKQITSVILLALLTGAAPAGYALSGAAATVPTQPTIKEGTIERVSFDEGASYQYIYCSMQDSRGFMWFGTMVGLIRYDGLSNTIYRHDPSDSTSLPNDDIISLSEDDSSNVWIGTFGGGLIRFDRASGTFRRVNGPPGDTLAESRSIVWDVLQDRSGAIWLATAQGGLVRYEPGTGVFRHFHHDTASAGSLPSNVVLSLEETEDGAIWAGTGGGLARLAPGEETFTVFHPGGEAPIRALHQDREGRLWVGTQGDGLFRYDGGGTFTSFRSDPKDPGTLSSNFINCIRDDGRGVLWIGAAGGLNKFLPAEGRFGRFLTSHTDEHTLPGNNIITLCPDRSGVLWVGAYLGGLAKVLPWTGFEAVRGGEGIALETDLRDVTAFLPTGPSSVMVGTSAGLMEYDHGAGTLREHPYSAYLTGPPRRKVVTALLRDRRGRVWIGTLRGLLRVDGGSGGVRVFERASGATPGLSGDAVTSLLEDGNGEVWVGTQTGLSRYAGDSEGFTVFRPRLGRRSIANEYILSLFEDREGNLWVGTYGGINRLDPARDSVSLFRSDPTDPSSVSNNYCFAVTEDSAGALWLGTGGGLNRFIPESGKFEHFTERDGLPNAVICGILEAPAGTLWLSTHRGLSRFDRRSGEFRNFDLLDGLQSNMFTPGASIGTASGLLLFGGNRGFNAFSPGTIARRDYRPQVVITAVDAGQGPPGAPVSPEVRDAITLPYTENSFEVRAAAMDFARPEKISYAFRLEGYDPGWVSAGRSNHIRYTGVGPGEYVLRVISTNSDGVWNEAGASVPIVITPPYWMTWWFLGLSVSGIVAVALTAHRKWVRMKLRRVVEIEEIRESERKQIRKRAADDFHDEFGHKLTKISLLGQVVKRNLTTSPEESAGALEKIIATSAELSMGMRDFLWTLNPDRDSAYDVAVRLKDFGDDLFNSAGIGFQVDELSPSLEELKLNVEWRRHLILMFKEGMNNIVKHAMPGKVSLHVERTNGSLDIVLSDDGRGFDQGSVRAGQGLASMRHRAEKLRGTLVLETASGGGTTVRFHGDLPTT